MTQLTALTGGRTWAARLLILLPVVALIAVTVAVIPAGASHDGSPPSTKGIDPDKLQTVGGDFANCTAAEAFEGLPAGTITHFAFHNNPRQADGANIQVTDRSGVPDGDWSVLLSVAPQGRSFAYEVLNNGATGQSDGKLEAPRKQPNKTENLSHVTFCFSELPSGNSELPSGNLVLRFVEVKGSEGTNHYFYGEQVTVHCNTEVDVGGDGISGSFFKDCENENENESVTILIRFNGTEGSQSVVYDRVDGPDVEAALEQWTWVPEDLTFPRDIRHLVYDDGFGEGEQTAEFCKSDPRDDEFSLGDYQASVVLPEGHSTCIIEVIATSVGDELVQVTHLLFTIGDPVRRW